MLAADPDDAGDEDDDGSRGMDGSRIGGYAYPGESEAPESDDDATRSDRLLGGTVILLVELIVGSVIGGIVTLVGMAVLGSGWGFMLGVLVWFGATVKLVKRETVTGTLRLAGYGLAAALLTVPLVALGSGAGAGTVETRVAGVLVLALPAGLGALLAAGFGYWIGQRASEA